MVFGTVQGLDKEVSRLVLGTMILRTSELENGFSLLDSAFDLGYTTLDTAHVYAGGESERVLGMWMKERNNRDKVVILSKGAHHNIDRKRVTPHDITSDLYDSLARLKTEYVDIYLLHRDDAEIPVGPIVEILNQHHGEGRIKSFGASNWRHERINEANDYARIHGLIPFTASSPNFSLAEQVEEPWDGGCVTLSGPQEEEARKWYLNSGLPVFAYSSLARGFFSGRLSSKNIAGTRENLDQFCRKAYCYDQNYRRLGRVEALAEKMNLSVAETALAYVLNHPLKINAIVGAANAEELKSNLKAIQVKLTENEMAWLDLKRDFI